MAAKFKTTKKLRTWRKKKKRGAIMKPKTFSKIEKSAAKKYGKKRGAKIAGRAYWNAAKSKFKKTKSRKRKK